MRSALAIAGLLLSATLAAAGDIQRLTAFDVPDRPSELPPLLKVPPASQPPAAGPRGPSGEYDPGYFYLPERSPDGPRPKPCGPEGRIWIGAGLELAWMKPPTAPPLLRLGSVTGPILYGGQSITSPMQAALSVDAGFWLNEARTFGFDASFFYSNGAGSETLIGPTASAVLVLPPALVLSDPAADAVGAFQAGLRTSFSSADVNSRTNLFCSSDARLDTIAGYRYARLSDDYEVYGKRLTSGSDIVRFRDEAHTRNQFHGGQIGLVGELRSGHWFVAGSGKVAFGVAFSDSELTGKFRVNEVVVPFGYYARPGLSGSQERSQFAVMPVAELSVGREIGDHLRIAVGYQFLSLNRVVRAPDLLEPALQPVFAAGEAPVSNLWVQSLGLTAEFRY